MTRINYRYKLLEKQSDLSLRSLSLRFHEEVRKLRSKQQTNFTDNIKVFRNEVILINCEKINKFKVVFFSFGLYIYIFYF